MSASVSHAPASNYDGFDIATALASADPVMLWTAHRLNRERVQLELAIGRARLDGDDEAVRVAERRIEELPAMSPLQALTVARLLGSELVSGRWQDMDRAHKAGDSWSEIGAALGMSKQGAYDYYHRTADQTVVEQQVRERMPDRPRGEQLVGDATQSRSELVSAIPAIQRLVKQLHQALRPALAGETEAPESKALFQAATAIRWIADALGEADHAVRAEKLTEAVNRSTYVAQDVHQRLAELQSTDEMGANEVRRRETSYGTEAIIERAKFDVLLPNGHSTTVNLAVGTDGRVVWQASTVALDDVNGLAQLALTTALTQISETLTTALLESAFEEPW